MEQDGGVNFDSHTTSQSELVAEERESNGEGGG